MSYLLSSILLIILIVVFSFVFKGEEPAITNCNHAFKDYKIEMCTDYIWFNKETLGVTDVLQTPPSEDILKHHALPSAIFPSDHIPLQVEFMFK